LSKLRFTEACAREVRVAEIGSVQAGLAEVRSHKVCSAKVFSRQPRFAEVRQECRPSFPPCVPNGRPFAQDLNMGIISHSTYPFGEQLKRLHESTMEKGLDEVVGMAQQLILYSIKSASRSGSMTPFWSLDLSKPFADSARSDTVTLSAISARLATAFHA
jgi:hypothetical protein